MGPSSLPPRFVLLIFGAQNPLPIRRVLRQMPPRPRRKGVVVLAAAALAGAVALRLTAGFGLVTHTAPSLAAVGPRALLRSANLVARAADELEAKMVLVQELKHRDGEGRRRRKNNDGE